MERGNGSEEIINRKKEGKRRESEERNKRMERGKGM